MIASLFLWICSDRLGFVSQPFFCIIFQLTMGSLQYGRNENLNIRIIFKIGEWFCFIVSACLLLCMVIPLARNLCVEICEESGIVISYFSIFICDDSWLIWIIWSIKYLFQMVSSKRKKKKFTIFRWYCIIEYFPSSGSKCSFSW